MKKITLLSILAFAFVISNAQLCLSDFQYQMPITVSNPNNDTLWDHQVKINFNSELLIQAGKMQIDGSDLRFGDNCCNMYCFSIEDSINTDSTNVWIKIPMIPANDSIEFLMVYGNSTAPKGSNSECTFDFFESFSDSITQFDTSCFAPTSVVDSNGFLNLSWSNNGKLYTKQTFSGYVYTAEMKIDTAEGSWPGLYWLNADDSRGYSNLYRGSASNVRIAYSSAINNFCQSANWGSPEYNVTGVEGIWALTWVDETIQIANFPTIGEYNSNGINYFPKNDSLVLGIGGLSSGSGSMNIDWVRVRKYSDTIPTYSIGVEGPTSILGVDLGSNKTVCEDESLTLNAGAGFVSYLWSNNDTTQSININTSAVGTSTYSVTAVDSSNCTTSSSVQITVNDCNPTPGNIEELNDQDVLVAYPNPVKDFLYLKLNDIEGDFEIKLYSAVGSIVVDEVRNFKLNESQKIDLSEINKGTYLLRLNSETKSSSIQIIIE